MWKQRLQRCHSINPAKGQRLLFVGECVCVCEGGGILFPCVGEIATINPGWLYLDYRTDYLTNIHHAVNLETWASVQPARETLAECWLDVGLASVTPAQHQTNTEIIYLTYDATPSSTE